MKVKTDLFTKYQYQNRRAPFEKDTFRTNNAKFVCKQCIQKQKMSSRVRDLGLNLDFVTFQLCNLEHNVSKPHQYKWVRTIYLKEQGLKKSKYGKVLSKVLIYVTTKKYRKLQKKILISSRTSISKDGLLKKIWWSLKILVPCQK